MEPERDPTAPQPPPTDPYTPEPGPRPGEQRAFGVLKWAWLGVAVVVAVVLWAVLS